MRKKISLFLSVLSAVIAALALTGCADHGAPKHDVDDSGDNYVISASVMEQKLEEFMDGRENRTSFTNWESKAADYLYDTLKSYGYDDARIEWISVTDGNSATRLESQNVIAVHKSAADGAKNVVIGAYYDNWYSTPYKGAAAGTKGAGALSNGTGVATLLAIAEYLKADDVELGFDVSIVFFGASATTVTGASYYYEEHMTATERRNTVLMIELQRLGADHIYAFSDARKTKREGFFDDIAAANGLDIYKPTQKSPVMTMAYSLDGIPFFQWAQTGVYSVFFNKSVPTLNVIGGNWETINMSDAEYADRSSVSFTEDDTLAVLKKACPDYGSKMSAAATLVLRSLTDERFLETMVYDKENFPDTDILLKRWIWYLIAFGVVIIAAFAMSLVNRRLARKYPISAPRPQRMKMAVFGMDYEDKSSGDIFIDIGSARSGSDEIFPGIPNNDVTRGSVNGADPIFPMFAAPSKQNEQTAKDDKARDDVQDVFGLNDAAPAGDASRGNIVDGPNDKQSVKDGGEQSVDTNTATDDGSVADVKGVDGGSNADNEGSAEDRDMTNGSEKDRRGATADKARATGKTERKPTATKRPAASTRKTVSAGKSTSAQKTTRKTGDGSVGKGGADKESGDKE